MLKNVRLNITVENFKYVCHVTCQTATDRLINTSTRFTSGPGSSAGIATDYEPDGPGSNPGGDEIFRPSRQELGSTQSPVILLPGLPPGG